MGDIDRLPLKTENGNAISQNGSTGERHTSGGQIEDLFLQKYGLAAMQAKDSDARSSKSGSSSTGLSWTAGSTWSVPSAGSGHSSKNGHGMGQGSVPRKAGRATSSQNDVTCSKLNYVKHGLTKHRDPPPTPTDTKSVKNGEGEGIPLEIPARQPTQGGGTGTARHKVNKSGNQVTSIPEEEINIPNDGNLASFSADAMATFLRYLRLEDRLVNHLHRNGLDGRKFGRLKDSDLENLKLQNPVLVYFRDRTAPAVAKKPKQRLPFVL